MAATTEQLLQDMLDFMRSGGGVPSGGGGGGGTAPIPQTTLDKIIKALNAAEKSTRDLTSAVIPSIAVTNRLKDAQQAQVKNYKALKQEFDKGTISADKYRRELSRLEQASEQLTETVGVLNKEEEKKLKKLIEEGRDQAQRSQKMEELAKSFTVLNGLSKGISVGFAAIGKIGSAVGDTLQQIQSGAGGSAVASGILKSEIELTNSAVQTAASGISTVGGAMKSKWGPALQIGAAALGAFSNAVSAAAKKSIDILTKEIDKQTQSYHTMASAGALFTDGIDGMMQASGEAGLSVKTMGDMVKNNTDALYRSGLGIAGATKKMSSTFAAGGDGFKKSLLNLGYSIEEQGALVSETMGWLKLSGRNLAQMTGGEIKTETENYAKNLKLISAITGEDAKKRLEQAREASANAAVQAKLALMDPKERKQFELDLATVPEGLKNAVLQQRVLGVVTEKNANILSATIPGAADSIQAFAAGLGKGAEGMGLATEKWTKTINDSNASGAVAEMGAAALAGVSGPAADFITALSKMTLAVQKTQFGEGDTAKTMSDIDGMADTTSQATQALSSLQVQGENLAAQFEKLVKSNLITQFGDLLVATNAKMEQALAGAGKAIEDAKADSKKSESKWYDISAREALEFGGAGIGGAIGGFGGTVAGGGIASIPGAILGAAGGGTVGMGIGAVIADFLGLPPNPDGMAKGGISSGSDKGYLQKMHGTELVIPMLGNSLDVNSKGFDKLQYLTGMMSKEMAGVESLGGLDKGGKDSPIPSVLADISRFAASLGARPEEMAQSAPEKAAVETKIEQKEKSNLLIDEIRKMNALLEKQLELEEDSADVRRRLLEATNDHKRVSEKIFQTAL